MSYVPDEADLSASACAECSHADRCEAQAGGTPILRVIRLQAKYKTYWRDKSDWFWAWKLFQEFCELIGSLLGLHKDPAKWELMQIAAICINWIRKMEKPND